MLCELSSTFFIYLWTLLFANIILVIGGMMIKNNIKKLRLEMGLTQKELGKNIELAESTISLYESGKREPDNATLLTLANFFDVSVDYLLGRTDKPELLAAHTADDSHDLTPEQREELEQFKQFIIQRDKNK